MTTPNHQPTPPPGMEILTDYTKLLPDGAMFARFNEEIFSEWIPIDPYRVGLYPLLSRVYAIPITPTKGGEQRPIPKALYPCKHCYHERTWPAEDLHWSELAKGWVCRECWDSETHGDPGPSLKEEIEKGGEPCASTTRNAPATQPNPEQLIQGVQPTDASNAPAPVQSQSQGQELLPCPFCGGAPIIVQGIEEADQAWRIFCNNEDCNIIVECQSGFTKEDNINRWNTRK